MGININFGKYNHMLGWIDIRYNNVATRMIEFAKEAGPDKYNRIYNFEPVLEFAITDKMTGKSIDYIYRHYVYHLLSQVETIDINQEELDYHLSLFITF